MNREEFIESYVRDESVAAAPDLRERLILCGIAELEERGVRGFSLRRVAAASGVSCAAPYKHFKDKEEMLGAILGYIEEKWGLLEDHILSAYGGDDGRLLTELAVAYVRFWHGNPSFRSAHLALEHTDGRCAGIGRGAEAVLTRLCATLPEPARAERAYTVRALILGTVAMLTEGAIEDGDSACDLLQNALRECLSQNTFPA